MGSGIAAQLCNANVPVTLLDLKTEISEKAKKRIFESRPPLLVDKSKNQLQFWKLKLSNSNFKGKHQSGQQRFLGKITAR